MATVQAGERRYTVVLTPDDGGYMVTVPALPGCFTQGATVEQALERAREAIRTHITGLKVDGEPVPLEDERPRLALVEV